MAFLFNISEITKSIMVFFCLALIMFCFRGVYSTNMKEYILLLLVALSSAKPFQKPSYFTFKNIMLMDMEDLDDDDDDSDDVDDDDKDDNSLFPTRAPLIPVDIFPVCPFGCQCYLRVVHCSDLGKDNYH